MKNINDVNYLEEIANNSNLVVLFWAEWCNQCPSMYPIIEELATTVPQITVAKCDTEVSNDFINECHIMSLPTLAFFKDGKYVKSLPGKQNVQTIKDYAESLFNLQAV